MRETIVRQCPIVNELLYGQARQIKTAQTNGMKNYLGGRVLKLIEKTTKDFIEVQRKKTEKVLLEENAEDANGSDSYLEIHASQEKKINKQRRRRKK